VENSVEKLKKKMKRVDFGIKTVAIVGLVLLVLSTAVISADAHVSGAEPLPEFELEPIFVYDGDTHLVISIDNIGEYHGGICVCGGCAFRAAQLGLSEIWGDEIPARDDLRIISKLPTPGSRDCFQYVTGTGPEIETKTKGEYKIILPDGTEVTNMTEKNLKKVSKDNTLDNFRFDICRKSTGECFEVVVKEGVFPDDYFELRKKVKYGIPEDATTEEKALFKSEWAAVREKFLTNPDWELFEGIEEPEEPFPVGSAIFFLISLIGPVVLLIMVYSGKKSS